MTLPKILFVSSEVAPLARTGGLGDVMGALPKALRSQGCDARLIMPLYKTIKDKYADQLTFVRWTMIKLGWRTMYSGLMTMELDGVPVYLIDNEYYFGHDGIYLDYSFDIERFSFFQRAALEAVGQAMDFEPDVLHLNDWHTAMIPSLLEAHYRPYGFHQDIRTVLTIHNLKYQGIHGRERIADLLDIPDRFMSEYGILKDGMPNFLKAGIVYADRVTVVSPTYAAEVMTDYYGEGLQYLLQSQAHKVFGILNGIDTDVYNPKSDPNIPQPYDLKSASAGKAACKLALQQELGLDQSADTALLGMVSRLTDQKGLDLLLHVLEEILEQGCQMAVLGTGDAHYESALETIAKRHRGRLAVRIAFDSALSHRFYAASDLFIMPSLFEPCGLSQMIAMRYGSLPVVRETGGLKDTVKAYDPLTGEGTGFSFKNINAHELLFTVQAALELREKKPEAWRQLIQQAMSGDFSWLGSAQSYLELYRQVIA